jgi:hypothetical protein
MNEALRAGSKAEFALDLLEMDHPSDLKPPKYIREGLLWLAAQLEQEQADLGLISLTPLEAEVGSKADAVDGAAA